MTMKETMSAELRAIHDGDAWHGPSLKEILAGVTAEQAAAHLLPAAHSIWELVLHISAWENVFLCRLAGEAITVPKEGDFPPVSDVSDDAWQRALARLDETHAQLLAAVAALSEAQWQQIVVGKDYTVEYLLHGIVRHHVYHAGQIALLKKLI
ncbi:MAG: DinB family protein [Acidobacteria bacterium]|nr:DinB family protein [Acidobacteriota bacterium]